MKYYIIKDRDKEGYLSKTLCRVNDDGSFEEYSCNANSSSGEWRYNEIVEKWFKGEDENFEVYEALDKKEIEQVIYETDDAAYENFHTHYNDELIDSKGRKHREYIYQDYRSLDGYNADSGFVYQEIWNREDYNYYLDEKSNILIKIDKETQKIYEYNSNIWKEINKTKIKKLKEIKDFNIVIDYIDR